MFSIVTFKTLVISKILKIRKYAIIVYEKPFII
jgi:hypothetical protein